MPEPFGLGNTNVCEDINFTSLETRMTKKMQSTVRFELKKIKNYHLSMLAIIAIFSVGVCSIIAQRDAKAR